MQLVKQTTVVFKDGQFAQVRWDNIEKVLMFQNNPNHTEMSLDDYMNRRQNTLKKAKEKGWLVSEIDVPIDSLWSTKTTINLLFK